MMLWCRWWRNSMCTYYTHNFLHAARVRVGGREGREHIRNRYAFNNNNKKNQVECLRFCKSTMWKSRCLSGAQKPEFISEQKIKRRERIIRQRDDDDDDYDDITSGKDSKSNDMSKLPAQMEKRQRSNGTKWIIFGIHIQSFAQMTFCQFLVAFRLWHGNLMYFLSAYFHEGISAENSKKDRRWWFGDKSARKANDDVDVSICNCVYICRVSNMLCVVRRTCADNGNI